MRFIKKTTYYRYKPTYEFNLPVGYSCPGAKDCAVCVEPVTGCPTQYGDLLPCRGAAAERFPSVRKVRWQNLRDAMDGKKIVLPPDAERVRIHAAGDFFMQRYFDAWLEVALKNPKVHFWACTKSIDFWVKRINQIPKNLVLTASYGSCHDMLISAYQLKSVRVFPSEDAARASGLMIDTDDYLAMQGRASFARVEKFPMTKFP